MTQLTAKGRNQNRIRMQGRLVMVGLALAGNVISGKDSRCTRGKK